MLTGCFRHYRRTRRAAPQLRSVCRGANLCIQFYDKKAEFASRASNYSRIHSTEPYDRRRSLQFRSTPNPPCLTAVISRTGLAAATVWYFYEPRPERRSSLYSMHLMNANGRRASAVYCRGDCRTAAVVRSRTIFDRSDTVDIELPSSINSLTNYDLDLLRIAAAHTLTKANAAEVYRRWYGPMTSLARYQLDPFEVWRDAVVRVFLEANLPSHGHGFHRCL